MLDLLPWRPFLLVALLLPWAPAQPTVRVATVRQETLQEHDRVTGSLRAAQEAVLAALEEGPLLEVRLKEAALVRKGEIVARTDTRRLDAQLLELDAEIERAKTEVSQREAELGNAERDVEAMRAAAEKNAISERQLRTAQTDLSVARSRLAAAHAGIRSLGSRITLLKVRLDDATLRAPFDGRVVARNAEPGEWVRPGDPIVTLVSTGTIEVWLEVPERHAQAVRGLDGNLAIELVGSSGRLKANRLRVVPIVHARARMMSLVADLDDDGGALFPGMSVAAWIPVSGREPRLLIPKDAVVRRPGLTAAYRLNDEPDGARVEQVVVSVLFETAELIAVAGPLAEGDRVVIEGNERLVDGTPVIVAHDCEPKRAPRVGPGISTTGGTGNSR